MRHVPHPLPELTAHAQALTSTGDLTGARAVLADALAPADADPRHATADLAEAAALHARILITLGDPYAAEGWADFAHAAQRRLHGPTDERTLAATATHAAVLHRIGDHASAAALYRDVVEHLTAADGPDSLRVLAAEADLATAEHAAGNCGTACARLLHAWQRHRDEHGDAAPAGIKMLARLGSMERDCGRDEAGEHLVLASELCARYLPEDHALARQVAALTRAPASAAHRCEPAAPGVTGLPPGVTELPRAAGVTRLPRAEQLGSGADPRLPVPVHPAGPPTSRRPFVVAAVLTAGALLAAAAVAVTLPGDRDVTAPSAGAATPPGATGPGTAAAVPSAGTPSAAPAPSTATLTSAATTTTAANAVGPAPSGVKLRDGGDSVALDWTYPGGAEGPVLISGGRTGQQARAFQQLPAGSADYVVYGLNERADYCFTVSVVYSAEGVAASPSVCTSRT
jgi:hypothetical protein